MIEEVQSLKLSLEIPDKSDDPPRIEVNIALDLSLESKSVISSDVKVGCCFLYDVVLMV